MKEIIINKYIQIFLQEPGEDVGLLSLPYPQIKSLSNITTTNDTIVRCKSNASFFEREGSKAILGRNIGIRADFKKVNEAPDQINNKTLYAVTVFEDNSYVIDAPQSWDHRDNVKLSYSIPLVLINNGQDVNLYSTQIGITSNRINQLGVYTYFFKLKDGKFGLIGSEEYRPANLRKALRDAGYQFEFLVQNDGNSSAQINLDGKVVFNKDGVENPIPNSVIFYTSNKPVNEEIKDAKEYAVFPMPEVYISQGVGGKTSHYPNIKALDLAHRNDRYARIFAPFTMKVIGVRVNNKDANEVIWGSCDEDGNKCKVRCADGIDRVLTFVSLHDDTIEEWTLGKVVKTGEYCGNIGMAGYSLGPHAHIEVAEGYNTSRKARNGSISFEIKNAINPGNVFVLLEGWNAIYKANGMTFKNVESRSIKNAQNKEIELLRNQIAVYEKDILNISKEIDNLKLKKDAIYASKKTLEIKLEELV